MLRKKLETNAAQPKLLLTVPGVGYLLAAAVTPSQ
jgi:DNA-binding response OmpR family regulator